MHTITKSAIVNYSSKQMFDLINNIDDYPLFLSWCSDSKITHQTNKEISAYITINKGVFQQKFSTRNKLYPFEKITMELINGPFKTLIGSWQLDALKKDACKITFNISFAFKSKIMDLTLSSAFSAIANTQLNAFINRAKEVYK